MTDSRYSSPHAIPADAPASRPSSDAANTTSHGEHYKFAGRNGSTMFPASLIIPLEPTSLRDVVTEDSIKDVIRRLIHLRSDAVQVVNILDNTFWHSNHEAVDAAGASFPSHQPRHIVGKIDAMITRVVLQEYPHIPQTLHRLGIAPEILPRVDRLSLRASWSPALVRAMVLIDTTNPDDLGCTKLRIVLEDLPVHERLIFCHYLRSYGYATLVYEGDWDAHLYFRMRLEGRPVEIVLVYGDREAPWPISP